MQLAYEPELRRHCTLAMPLASVAVKETLCDETEIVGELTLPIVTVGAVVSTMIVADWVVTFPAVSVARTYTVWVPAASVPVA